MWIGWRNSGGPGSGPNWKRVVLGGAGVALGGAFLWLAMRDVEPAVVASTLQQINGPWLVVRSCSI